MWKPICDVLILCFCLVCVCFLLLCDCVGFLLVNFRSPLTCVLQVYFIVTCFDFRVCQKSIKKVVLDWDDRQIFGLMRSVVLDLQLVNALFSCTEILTYFGTYRFLDN